jgi:hypothetical protein
MSSVIQNDELFSDVDVERVGTECCMRRVRDKGETLSGLVRIDPRNDGSDFRRRSGDCGARSTAFAECNVATRSNEVRPHPTIVEECSSNCTAE